VAGGPSFEDHVAMIHEKAQLSEHMEVIEGELQALDYLVTWLSVQLEDAELICLFALFSFLSSSF